MGRYDTRFHGRFTSRFAGRLRALSGSTAVTVAVSPDYFDPDFFDDTYFGGPYWGHDESTDPVLSDYAPGFAPGWVATLDEGVSFDKYVDGSVAASGNVSARAGVAAYKTIAEAITAASRGDRIGVLDFGSPYRESATFTSKGGNSAADRTVLCGWSTDKPTLHAGDVMTGFVACDSGDATYLGGKWVSCYKKTGVLKSLFPSSLPGAMNLHENDVAMTEAIDRPSSGEDAYFTRVPATYYTADTFRTTGDAVASVSNVDDITGIADLSVTNNYTTAQLEAASALFYRYSNATGRSEITDFTTPVLHLATTTFKYQSTGANANHWCLINIAPAIAAGGYAYVEEDATHITVYIYPTSGAPGTITYSARENIISLLSESHIEIASLKLLQAGTASTLNNGCAIRSTIYTSGLKSDIVIRNCYMASCQSIEPDGGGYGVVYLSGVSIVKFWNNTVKDGRGMYGVSINGGGKNGASTISPPNFGDDIDVRFNDVRRIEQSPFRDFTVSNFVLAFNYVYGCGRAAHANKTTFYIQCYNNLVYGNLFVFSGGYATWQECNNIHFAFNFISNNADPSVSYCVLDQNHGNNGATFMTPNTYYAPAAAVDCLFYNNTCPPEPTNPTYVNNWRVGRTTEDPTVYFQYFNNIIHGDAETGVAQIVDRDYQIDTIQAPAGAHSEQANVSSIYLDAPNDDYTFVVGSLAYTKVGKNMQSLITSILEPMFGVASGRTIPFTDFDKDAFGQPVTWTGNGPPVGHKNNRP